MRSSTDATDVPRWSDDETISGDPAGAAVDARPHPSPGTQIGRYVVASGLGAGAMGVVVAAYDPKLDRKVAIKLLRPRAGRDEEVARARLLREARALARLNDDNVVGVHDVGVHEGRVFIAMEFVEGQTLAGWLKSRDGRPEPRPWPDVVKVFEAAGRGLAAAHRHGLVHRDFKPHNVMLEDGARGRVRVMDFGLALDEEGPTQCEPSPGPLEPSSSFDRRLTRTGALLGTPAYMAPEQFSGEVTARSDQFAYCVALFEALYGVLPFRGETVAELSIAVLNGKVVVPPPPAGVPPIPRWLRVVVLRGLSPDPRKRFDDMPALLAALEAGGTRRARRRALAAVGTVGLVIVGFVGYQRWQDARRTQACVAEGNTVDEIWNDARRAEVRDGLLATGAVYAASTAAKVVPFIDAQAEALRSARKDICLATEMDGVSTELLFDRAVWCIDERRIQLEALIHELSAADNVSAAEAVVAASTLSPVSSCRNAARLMHAPAPPEARVEVETVSEMLSRTDVLGSAGKYEPALELSRQALARSEALAWPALTAAARRRVGSSLLQLGRYDTAQASLETAYFEATEAGATEVMLDAATALIHVNAKGARFEEARGWARHAEAAFLALQEPADGLRRAELDNSLGLLHMDMARHAEAKELFERALEIRENVLGPDHPSVAQALRNLAFAHREMGSYAIAETLYERALATVQTAWGADHPDVASAMGTLASVHYETGAYDEALAEYERALAITRESLGPEHPAVGSILTNVSLVHRATGDYDEAIRQCERAVAVYEGALGRDHLDVAAPRDNLGLLYRATGEYDQAQMQHERALAIREAMLGPEHPDVATSLFNLALVHRTLGAHDEARAGFERALDILETVLGPEHPSVAHPLQALAYLALQQDRPTVALPLAERALAIRTSAAVPPEMVADSRFVLARALWEAPSSAGRDRVRAHALATQARDVYREDEALAGSLDNVEAWLAKRPAPRR